MGEGTGARVACRGRLANGGGMVGARSSNGQVRRGREEMVVGSQSVAPCLPVGPDKHGPPPLGASHDAIASPRRTNGQESGFKLGRLLPAGPFFGRRRADEDGRSFGHRPTGAHPWRTAGLSRARVVVVWIERSQLLPPTSTHTSIQASCRCLARAPRRPPRPFITRAPPASRRREDSCNSHTLNRYEHSTLPRSCPLGAKADQRRPSSFACSLVRAFHRRPAI